MPFDDAFLFKARGHAVHFSPKMSHPNGLCIFVHNRASAANFSPRQFQCKSIINWGLTKEGTCCPLLSRIFSCKSALRSCSRQEGVLPVFSTKFFKLFSIFLLGGSKTGGNAASFFQELSMPFDFAFVVQNKAKCCQFFSNSSLVRFDFLFFWFQRQGKCCPFFGQTIS